MNELQTSNMKTPIEIALGVDENGMTTAKALYEFLSGEKSNFSKWAKRNIEQNEFYEENKDWWGFVTVTNGNECKDYRLCKTSVNGKPFCKGQRSKTVFYHHRGQGETGSNKSVTTFSTDANGYVTG